MKILVVDDDQAVRESLRRSLTFNGYLVELAGDGVEAVERLDANRPDAVILDVMMPRRDGLEVCRILRSRGDDLPVLMLTARDAVSERVAGLDAGADDYLPKPFALEELLAGCGRCCVVGVRRPRTWTRCWSSRTCGWTWRPARSTGGSDGSS